MNLASLSGQIPGEIKVEEYSVVDRAVQCHVQVAAINKAVQTVDNESELLSIGRVFYGMNYETLEGTHENQSEDEPINGDHIVQSVYNSIFYIKELLGPNSSHTPFTNITQLCSKFTGVSGMTVYNIVKKKRMYMRPRGRQPRNRRKNTDVASQNKSNQETGK